MRAHSSRYGVFFVVVAGLFGCDATSPPGGTAPDGAAVDADDAAVTPDGPVFDARPADDAGDAREVIGVEIDPGNASLTARNGDRPTLALRAYGVRRDGARVVMPNGVWSLSDLRLGDINGDGLFTASGVGGGTVTVRVSVTGARAMVLNATTTLSVVVQRDVFDPPRPNLAAPFAGATLRNDPARATRIVYPLDGALMPNNVAPATLQWERGAEGDIYRVRIAKRHAVTTVYLEHTGNAFTFAHRVGAEAWRAAVESDLDDALTVTVDRWEMATGDVLAGSPVRVRFSHGAVYGSVYYWNLLAGRMARIRPDAATSVDLIPQPAPRMRDGTRCVACHTVSRDGRYLAAQTTTGAGMGGGVFDLTADLTVDPAPTVAAAGAFQCASFNPDGTRLVTCATDRWAGAFGMINPRTGADEPVTGLPTENATQPEWSPDGRNIAYIANVALDSQGNPVRGDLALLRDPGTRPTVFDAPRIVHRGSALAMATPAGETDAYPTWSPNSRYLAFQHGAGAFSMTGPGALYHVERDGDGTPWRLDRANGGANGVESFRPTFSPFTTEEGGGRRLLWLAYFSRRDYGNAQAGTRGTRRRQIWVTAVEASPRAGEDPSHVGYWLPGQDVSTENLSAYWAAEACRMTGEVCRSSADCCGGSCRPDPMDATRSTCQPPPPAECRRRGQTCGSTNDCCMGLMCYGNVCDMPPA
jgi:hypothetical protein